MSIKKIVAASCFSLLFAAGIYARTKDTGLKNGSKYIKMIAGYAQGVLPGAPGMKPRREYKFILVWESKETPATFYWRGDNGLMDCRMLIVHGYKQAKEGQRMEDGEYITENITNSPLKKGDTLEITPVAGGKFPIPQEIPADAKNTLFFKTVKSTWLSFAVKSIQTKPDVVMP